MTLIIKPASIACIGECMVELTQTDVLGENNSENEKFLKVNFAGDTLNTTVYMARLLKEASASQQTDIAVRYVTALGQDNFSSRMLAAWQSEGIDTRHVYSLSGKLPGLYSVNVDATGERSFHYWRSESAARSLFSDALTQDQIESIASENSLIFLSGITVAILPYESRKQLVNLLKIAKHNGSIIAFDTNHRPALWKDAEDARQWYQQILELTDIALLTFEDEQLLFNDQSVEDTLQRLEHIPELIIKRGSSPCLVKSNGEVQTVVAQKVSTPVDTTGAGDSFNGAYLSSRMLGASPVEACQAGHRLAAEVIMHRGGVIPKEVMPAL
ncbi:sugar kinase [Endozoicomonas elysicola]|uniref:sugar kinase n=1 Tax=Endozoicomonas elysicola TaxID=305900 RepID=UPI00037EEBFC|nr:sugar kinase [Endozoicomonas elysicola]